MKGSERGEPPAPLIEMELMKNSELEKIIGYRFKNQDLLTQALCHSSYANEHFHLKMKHNERLEFLGDAVLEMISSNYLFLHYPDLSEGKLSSFRASIVCEPTLAGCAREIGIDRCLMLGKGEENMGGRRRDSLISDCLEALIGAIYLDGGFTDAKEFVERFIMTDLEHKKLFYDSKTILQEIVQRDRKSPALKYVISNETGPDHAKTFTSLVYLGDEVIGKGEGNTKKSAEQAAAYHALLELRKKDK